jgi:hypothetical protein
LERKQNDKIKVSGEIRQEERGNRKKEKIGRKRK